MRADAFAGDLVRRGYQSVQRMASGSIQGQLLRFSPHREVALYLREGSVWIAEFIDRKGVLVDVPAWLRFNCGTPSNACAARRTSLESAIPLSADLFARIESLHQAATTKE
jgi:hypothetical protein